MSKRKTAPMVPVTPEKKATPANPHPVEKSKVQVNSRYDEMPDTIEDPASVYKLAYLDMQRVAINNKLAVVIQEFDKQQAMLNTNKAAAIGQVKAELRDSERRLSEQKAQIEQVYGIALRSYTYNDETGVLTKQAVLETEEHKTPEIPDKAPMGDGVLH